MCTPTRHLSVLFLINSSSQQRPLSCSRQGCSLKCYAICFALNRITTEQAPGTCKDASDSLTELISLSKKLAAVRVPPRVIGVQGAAQLSQVTLDGASHGVAGGIAIGGDNTDSGEVVCSSSASATWQAQQVINARLESEWREGQGRAAKALTSLLASGAGGTFGSIL